MKFFYWHKGSLNFRELVSWSFHGLHSFPAFNFVLFVGQTADEKEELEPWLVKEMDELLSEIWLTGNEDCFSQLIHLIKSENVSGIFCEIVIYYQMFGANCTFWVRHIYAYKKTPNKQLDYILHLYFYTILMDARFLFIFFCISSEDNLYLLTFIESHF